MMNTPHLKEVLTFTRRTSQGTYSIMTCDARKSSGSNSNINWYFSDLTDSQKNRLLTRMKGPSYFLTFAMLLFLSIAQQ